MARAEQSGVATHEDAYDEAASIINNIPKMVTELREECSQFVPEHRLDAVSSAWSVALARVLQWT